MNPIITVNHLHKWFRVAHRRTGIKGMTLDLFARSYKDVHAVDGVTFSVMPGEMIGYLGPNGAGKSTTLKILTGLLVPTRGEVLVSGMVPWRERVAYVKTIGAVFGQRNSLWWDLPVIESLELVEPMYDVPHDRFQSNLKIFRGMLELDEFINTPVRSLSQGQLMRAELCATFLHDPHIVFLDEPTVMLDVVAKERIRSFISQVNRERGTTVILTTHDLADVERLCERVLIIDHGKILYDGLLQELINRYEGSRLLKVTFSQAYESISLPGLDEPIVEGIQATFAYDPKKISAARLLQQLQNKYDVVDIEMLHPAIEDTIRKIYEQGLLLQPPG